ncbi:MAG: hypothetical protein PHV97_03190 [Candidatus Omnitrophica bacterium]|nr:hypothetical protein [Candidatus Omnitrophota bacterium]
MSESTDSIEEAIKSVRIAEYVKAKIDKSMDSTEKDINVFPSDQKERIRRQIEECRTEANRIIEAARKKAINILQKSGSLDKKARQALKEFRQAVEDAAHQSSGKSEK